MIDRRTDRRRTTDDDRRRTFDDDDEEEGDDDEDVHDINHGCVRACVRVTTAAAYRES